MKALTMSDGSGYPNENWFMPKTFNKPPWSSSCLYDCLSKHSRSFAHQVSWNHRKSGGHLIHPPQQDRNLLCSIQKALLSTAALLVLVTLSGNVTYTQPTSALHLGLCSVPWNSRSHFLISSQQKTLLSVAEGLPFPRLYPPPLVTLLHFGVYE